MMGRVLPSLHHAFFKYFSVVIEFKVMHCQKNRDANAKAERIFLKYKRN